MPIDRYRRVLAHRSVRHALMLGLLVRIPIFAGGVVLTLHVVSTLGLSYGWAGLAGGVVTAAVGISGPWRGRLLDRQGLRRVVLPSLVVATACWSIAPFAGYWVLLALAGLAGLFVVPTFSVIRQAVILGVAADDRRTAISLDSVAVEMSFMAGPALGVWAATQWSTTWVLFGVEMAGVLAGVLLYVVNPAIVEDAPAAVVGADSYMAERGHRWLTGPFLAVCLAAFATTLVLGGSDIGIVAALRAFGEQQALGWVFALWGFGSLVGGLIYGGLSRPIPSFWLLGALALVTAPMAFAADPVSMAVLALVAGLLCAPTITATLDQIAQVVPAQLRGEAFGWHGSAMTVGLAIGSPAAGVAIDAFGWPAGFLSVAAIGLLVAVVGVGAGLRGLSVVVAGREHVEIEEPAPG